MKIPMNVPDPELDDKYWKDDEEQQEEGEDQEQEFQDPANGQSYYLPPIIKMTEETNNHENENEQINNKQDKTNTSTNTNNKQKANKQLTNSEMSGTISKELNNKHKMTPSPEKTPNNKTDQKKFKTSEQINREAEIKDMEIQMKTAETLEKILKTVNNHVDLKNIRISRTDNQQNGDSEGQNHG